MQGDAEQRHYAQIVFTRDALCACMELIDRRKLLMATSIILDLNISFRQFITVLAEVCHLERH